MPYTENLNDLHGRQMVNVVSGETFHIHDKNSSTLPKPSGWLSLKTMEDEINHILSRTESKFCTPNGGTCTSKTIGLLVRRHIIAGEFHDIGREASTRWASGPDLSMMSEAGGLDPAHGTFREYERVVDAKYLDEIRAQARQFSTKLLSRKSGVAECAIRNFKKRKKCHQTSESPKTDKGCLSSAKQKTRKVVTNRDFSRTTSPAGQYSSVPIRTRREVAMSKGHILAALRPLCPRQLPRSSTDRGRDSRRAGAACQQRRD